MTSWKVESVSSENNPCKMPLNVSASSPENKQGIFREEALTSRCGLVRSTADEQLQIWDQPLCDPHTVGKDNVVAENWMHEWFVSQLETFIVVCKHIKINGLPCSTSLDETRDKNRFWRCSTQCFRQMQRRNKELWTTFFDFLRSWSFNCNELLTMQHLVNSRVRRHNNRVLVQYSGKKNSRLILFDASVHESHSIFVKFHRFVTDNRDSCIAWQGGHAVHLQQVSNWSEIDKNVHVHKNKETRTVLWEKALKYSLVQRHTPCATPEITQLSPTRMRCLKNSKTYSANCEAPHQQNNNSIVLEDFDWFHCSTYSGKWN